MSFVFQILWGAGFFGQAKQSVGSWFLIRDKTHAPALKAHSLNH